MAAFDIDNDGHSDILLLDGQKGRLQILKTGDDKMYHFIKEIDISTWNIKKILFAPLTGTKAGSIVLFDADKFALITPRSGTMKLEQQFSYETTIKEGKYANLISGDINSDGRMDFVMVEYKRNHIEILTLNDDMQPVSATSFKVFEQKSYREEERRGAGACRAKRTGHRRCNRRRQKRPYNDYPRPHNYLSSGLILRGFYRHMSAKNDILSLLEETGSTSRNGRPPGDHHSARRHRRLHPDTSACTIYEKIA